MDAGVFGTKGFNAAGSFTGVAFLPDGSELLAVTYGSTESRVRRFAVSDGRLLGERVIEGAWAEISILPDRSWILSAATDAVRIDPNGKEVWRLTSGARAGGLVFISPDGSLVGVCGNKNCTVFAAENGKRRFAIKTDRQMFAAAFSSDGQYLATGSEDGVLGLFDQRGRELSKRKTTKILALAFAPDSTSLLSGHGQGEVALWELPALRPAAKFGGARHEFEMGGGAGCRWVSFLPGGLAVSLGNERLLRFWSLAGGGEARRIRVPVRHAQGAPTVISPDGRLLAMGGTDGALSVWTVEDGTARVKNAPPPLPSALALTPATVVVAGHHGAVAYRREDGRATELASAKRACATADGRILLFGTQQVLSLESSDALPKHIYELADEPSGAPALSPDGAQLALPLAKHVRIREFATGVEVARLSHDTTTLACAFGPNAGWLATADETAVHLWRLGGSPTKLRTTALPDGARVYGLAISNGGRIAVTYDEQGAHHFYSDSSLAFIDPRSGSVTATLKWPDARLGQVAFVGGARVAVADSAGRLLLADGALGAWIDFPEGSAVDEIRDPLAKKPALPVATCEGEERVEIAHVGDDGNVVLRALPRWKANDERFDVDMPKTAVAMDTKLFGERLRGACVLLGGTFGVEEKRFITETVHALGGKLAKKADAKVTHAVFAHRKYAARSLSANEKKLDELIANGATIVKLLPMELQELLLPTLAEAKAMLSGEIEGGISLWNEWRDRYHSEYEYPVRLRGIDLSGADLRKAKLNGVHFEEATLDAARFDNVALIDCVFRGARMRGANLDGANCYRTVFSGADLSEAKLGGDLTWARLDGANLQRADLTNARLCNTNMDGANLEGARLPPSSRTP